MLTGIFSGNSFVTAVALAKVWTLPNAVFVVVLSNRLGTTKIFVGNIRDGTTSESLRELFECYGRVTEADVLSGFGFVVSASALLRHPYRILFDTVPPRKLHLQAKYSIQLG